MSIDIQQLVDRLRRGDITHDTFISEISGPVYSPNSPVRDRSNTPGLDNHHFSATYDTSNNTNVQGLDEENMLTKRLNYPKKDSKSFDIYGNSDAFIDYIMRDQQQKQMQSMQKSQSTKTFVNSHQMLAHGKNSMIATANNQTIPLSVRDQFFEGDPGLLQIDELLNTRRNSNDDESMRLIFGDDLGKLLTIDEVRNMMNGGVIENIREEEDSSDKYFGNKEMIRNMVEFSSMRNDNEKTIRNEEGASFKDTMITKSQQDLSSFMKRNNNWVNKKNVKNNKAAKSKDKDELKECTFKPKIDKNSEKMLSTQDKGGLYNIESAKIRNINNKYLAQKEEDFLKECTFKPDIKSKNAQSKHYDMAIELIKNKIPTQSQLNCHLKSDENCTFTPEVIGVKQGMSNAAKEYTQTDAFARLYTQSPKKTTSHCDNHHDTNSVLVKNPSKSSLNGLNPSKARLESWEDIDSLNYRGIDVVQNVKKNNKNILPLGGGVFENAYEEEVRQKSPEIRDFLERQANFLEKRDMHLKNLLQSSQINTNPLLCQKSREIVESKSTDFETRNLILYHKKKNNQLFEGLNELDECTFQPQITKLAQEIGSRPVSHRYYEDTMKQRQNREALAQMVAEMELKGCTFRPELSTDIADVQSRLDLNNNIDTYISRVNRQNQIKEEKAKVVKDNRLVDEVSGCTFKPVKTELPVFVSKIAEEYKLRKQQLASTIPTRNINEGYENY